MNKKKQSFFVTYFTRPWFMVVFACCVFGFLHGLLFGLHTFIIFRHASLYEQIRAHGGIIQMPEDFPLLYKQA